MRYSLWRGGRGVRVSGVMSGLNEMLGGLSPGAEDLGQQREGYAEGQHPELRTSSILGTEKESGRRGPVGSGMKSETKEESGRNYLAREGDHFCKAVICSTRRLRLCRRRQGGCAVLAFVGAACVAAGKPRGDGERI